MTDQDAFFSANMSRLHGYLGASIKNLGSDLKLKLVKPAEAAEQLEALYNTMEWVWSMRYQPESDCAANIRSKYNDEVVEIRRKKLKK